MMGFDNMPSTFYVDRERHRPLSDRPAASRTAIRPTRVSWFIDQLKK